MIDSDGDRVGFLFVEMRTGARDFDWQRQIQYPSKLAIAHSPNCIEERHCILVV